MLGVELLLLAAQPANEAQPLLDVAIETCVEWVNNAQYQIGSAEDFLQHSGLDERGLVVASPPTNAEGIEQHFQVGKQNLFKIVTAVGSPQCRFSGFGDRDFKTGLAEAVKSDGFIAKWPLVDSFSGHRMYEISCYRSASAPRISLQIRRGYFEKTNNDVSFWGNVTPVTESTSCPFTLNL